MEPEARTAGFEREMGVRTECDQGRVHGVQLPAGQLRPNRTASHTVLLLPGNDGDHLFQGRGRRIEVEIKQTIGRGDEVCHFLVKLK